MPNPVDCMLVGFNEGRFPDYVDLVRSVGEKSGAFRDLRLAYVYYQGQPHRALDLLNTLGGYLSSGCLTNMDFVAPAILILGSRLHSSGLSFDYVSLFHRDKEKLAEKLNSGSCRSVAITTTLYIHPHPVREIVAFIREVSPKTPIIVGGPYVVNQVKACRGRHIDSILDYLGADVYVIAQEGEATLAEVVQKLKRNEALDEVPNLAFKSHATASYTFTRTQPESNDLRVTPDYSLFRLDEHRAGRFLSARTAKSCPFHCAFCAFPANAGAYTYLSVSDVEQQLDQIAAVGSVDTLSFIDDTFNVPRRRFEAILDLMIKKRYPFKWNCFYRSDHGNDKIIRTMKAAGCEGVFLGAESGSDAMLERMQKSARRRHYAAALRSFRDVGISTYASFIVGFPGETLDTARETTSLIEEERPDYFRAQLWYCDPNTPIWQSREEYGISGGAFNWRHDTMDAEQAADLIDEMFLSVRNSTWMPQWGFEQWSTFYLQRLGMNEGQIRRYVQLFNGLVAEQITGKCGDASQSRLLPEIRELSLRLRAITDPARMGSIA
jgi:anaerobic magnesium-protoporphyrin IX monomethyl ester cyclase